MGKPFSIWMSEEDEKELEKLKKKAKKEQRALSNYCKKILFGDKTK